ncbi:MAG: ABC transporter ATP-binding protein [Chloroflexi bacterium]|nr:ABC transporter ATP-binding protein [Chloroflexota bacterium]
MAAAATTHLTAYRDLLSTYLRPQGRWIAWLAAFLLSGIAVEVASPLLLGRFVDDALSGATQDTLLVLGGAFLVASILQQGLLVCATYVGERVAWSATNTLREDLTLHCLSLDAPFHERHTPGELIERVDGDVTAVASFFSQFVIQVLGNVLLLLGILVILCIYDVRIGAILTVFAAFGFVVMLKTRAIAVRFWVDFREASARLYGFIEEHLNGLEDLRTSGAEMYALGTLGSRASVRMRTARIARVLSGVAWSVPIVLSAIGTALIYGLTARLVGAGTLTIGAAFTMYFYVRLLFIPLNRISSQLEEFQRASAGIVRIQEVRAWRSALADPDEPVPIPHAALSFGFDHVEFGYRQNEPVLHDVTFDLAAGATLGLVGRTGSGKTTIIRLVARLWDVESGCVRVGGLDVRSVSRRELRARLGVVSQQPQLFRASLRDNLALFNRSISEERMLDALDELRIGDWVRELPGGLDTLIGPGGRGLSAGEAQLLGVARALLHDPGLVILDEPSSRLDPATEQLVSAAITRLLTGRTGLIVAHRLETLDRVDTVLVLEEGRVAEFGPRDVLSADASSHFARLLRSSMTDGVLVS